MRGVELVVGEAAQQAGLAHPRVPNQQQPEQHIVLLRHGRDSRGPAGGGRAAAGSAPLSLCHRGRWRERSGPAPALASPARSLARWSGEARLRRERGAGKLALAGGGRGQPPLPPLPGPPPVPCAAAAAGEGEGSAGDPDAGPGGGPRSAPKALGCRDRTGVGEGQRLRLSTDDLSGRVGMSAHPTHLANLDVPVPSLPLESHPKPDSSHSALPGHWPLRRSGPA